MATLRVHVVASDGSGYWLHGDGCDLMGDDWVIIKRANPGRDNVHEVVGMFLRPIAVRVEHPEPPQSTPPSE